MTAPLLARSAFKTSRLLDFCSQRELVKQIGHEFRDWPLVMIKELIDNAIDAAEEAPVAPIITIRTGQRRSSRCRHYRHRNRSKIIFWYGWLPHAGPRCVATPRMRPKVVRNEMTGGRLLKCVSRRFKNSCER